MTLSAAVALSFSAAPLSSAFAADEAKVDCYDGMTMVKATEDCAKDGGALSEPKAMNKTTETTKTEKTEKSTTE